MYTTQNFKTKKALREAVERGDRVEVYQPNDMVGRTQAVRDASFEEPTTVSVEGPHGVHKWYASVVVENGVVTKVR